MKQPRWIPPIYLDEPKFNDPEGLPAHEYVLAEESVHLNSQGTEQLIRELLIDWPTLGCSELDRQRFRARLDGFSNPEIAAMANAASPNSATTTDAVKQSIHRIRKAITRYLRCTEQCKDTGLELGSPCYFCGL